jgi:hypothetical protein
MKNFWSGFEKSAYDYQQEVKDLNETATFQSTDTPLSKIEASLFGAGVGGIMGAGIGALSHGPGRSMSGSAGLGGLAGLAIGGLAIGGLAGLLTAIQDRAEIKDAKMLMKMKTTDRDILLAGRARQNETNTRELHADYRHGEMIGELRSINS